MYPACFFKEELFEGAANRELLARLKQIVLKHKGSVVADVGKADHVIYPPAQDELGDPAKRLEWIRVVRKRDRDSFLVHRIFTPDSQDQWLRSGEVDEEAANDTQNQLSGEIWELTANWLLDTDAYNEWTSQEDYEVNTILTVSILLYMWHVFCLLLDLFLHLFESKWLCEYEIR